jgi:hypothetical protein
LEFQGNSLRTVTSGILGGENGNTIGSLKQNAKNRAASLEVSNHKELDSYLDKYASISREMGFGNGLSHNHNGLSSNSSSKASNGGGKGGLSGGSSRTFSSGNVGNQGGHHHAGHHHAGHHHAGGSSGSKNRSASRNGGHSGSGNSGVERAGSYGRSGSLGNVGKKRSK